MKRFSQVHDQDGNFITRQDRKRIKRNDRIKLAVLLFIIAGLIAYCQINGITIYL